MAKLRWVELGQVKLSEVVIMEVKLKLQLHLVLVNSSVFVRLVAYLYILYISYIHPFLLVSCSGSDTQKMSQINIIVGSVVSRLCAFIVCQDFDFIPSLQPNLCLKPHRSGGERFAIFSMGHSMQTVLSNPPVDGQIYARNLIGSAENVLLSNQC